jgi:hypothetical protein
MARSGHHVRRLDRSKADIERPAKPARPVENDPDADINDSQ